MAKKRAIRAISQDVPEMAVERLKGCDNIVARVCIGNCSTNGANQIGNAILTPYRNAANGRAIAKVFATNPINSAYISHRAVFESWFILLNPDQFATFRAMMRSNNTRKRPSCNGTVGSCADSTRSLFARASDFRYHDGKLSLPAFCN